MKNNKIIFLSCKNGLPFANSVLDYLNVFLEKENLDKVLLTEVIETRFANTEIKTEITESIRDSDCYVFQDVSNKTDNYSVNDNLFAILTLINAAKISGAKRVTVVIPTFPYARQDKIWGREGLSAKIVANVLEQSGADKVITLDLHNDALVGFFNDIAIEDLYAARTFKNYILDNLDLDNLVVSSPDIGGIKMANSLASRINVPLVTIYKERDYSKANVVDSVDLIGKVDGKDVILLDDILDTGGTLGKAVKLLKEKGAKNIYFFVSLCLLNDPATQRISKLYEDRDLFKIVTTDAVFHSKDFLEKNKWLEIIPISDYFAEVIFNLHMSRSIAKIFDK